MYALICQNVNDAFVDGRWWLKVAGKEEESRNGPVLVSPCPVMTTYRRPNERVLFDEVRDCNPFFHLFEAVWMLAGCNEVEPLLKYNKNMAQFADNGIIHGAYGHRWQTHFGHSQLYELIKHLRDNPLSRQGVLQMWDVREDAPTFNDVKDRPCNTHCYFRINAGRLDMTVCCRSNDIIWGAYGANAVHFSILQEFLANAIEVPIGAMYQLSNNFHIYKNVPRYEEMMAAPAMDINPYKVKVMPLDYIVYPGENPFAFLTECYSIIANDFDGIKSRWLNELVIPMIAFWHSRDVKDLQDMPTCDWKTAFIEWAIRRKQNVSK